jgi:Mn2+/Fe2+ NRAMP family transporter
MAGWQQFGYSMLWTMPFMYPFMAAIQEIRARIGRVTGRGIAGNLRQFYPGWLLYAIVASKAIHGTFVPNIALTPEYLGALVAVLGTTITPYLFFWQSSEEVEEMESAPREKALKRAPCQGPEHLQRISLPTLRPKRPSSASLGRLPALRSSKVYGSTP